MKKILFLIIFYCCINSVFCKKSDTISQTDVENVVYAEFGYCLIFYDHYGYKLSLNYERILKQWCSIRIGMVYSKNKYRLTSIWPGGYVGTQYNEIKIATIMINFFTKGNNRFGGGFGVSFRDFYKMVNMWYSYVDEKTKKFKIYPSAELKYRYQPKNGGVFFSVSIDIGLDIVGGGIGCGLVF